MTDTSQDDFFALPAEEARDLPKHRSWIIPVLVIVTAMVGIAYYAAQPKSWKADTYFCRGYITINGKPPVDAIVALVSVGDPIDSRESRPWGLVNNDGSYSLTTYEMFDGAPVGEYAVTVRWPMSLSSPSPDRLLGAYSETSSSPLIVKIKPGRNFLPSVNLKNVTVVETSFFQPTWQFN